MANMRKYWDKLPRFMKGHQTLRANLLHYNEYHDKDKKATKQEERPIDQANLITSIDGNGWGGVHRPVLDLDFEAALLPSSTPGHYHLFLDRCMTQEQYFRFLDVCGEVGILEEGYVDASKARGASSVRLPWINKDRPKDNAFDPSAHHDQLEHELRDAEQKVAELKEAIKSDPFSGW